MTFKEYVLLILNKSVKSVQNRLNEYFSNKSDKGETMTSSAFTQGRKKISHKLYIDINHDIVLENFYSDENIKKYRGLRLIAVDGSKVYLPYSEETKRNFTVIPNTTQFGVCKEYVGGTISVAYDVLENIAIDAVIIPQSTGEIDPAINHLEHAKQNDLFIYDRGYLSYELMSECLKANVNFLIRCPRKKYKEIDAMFDSDETSKVVTLERPKYLKNRKDKVLDSDITVRLVKVILSDGEVEVLVTSLLDEEKYPTEEFEQLYWNRWGVETYFDLLKNRLNLENFTGKTSESVRQDFYATILISNLETIYTREANEKLEDRSAKNKYRLKVNKSVSFNVIKDHFFEILANKRNSDDLFEKLNKLFMMKPTAIRPGRKFKRDRDKPRRSLNYHKRRKKIVF